VHDGQGEGSVGPRPDQLAEIAIESTHTVEIEKFVPKASIITIATRPTYLAPEDMVGQEAFAVIRDAMKKKSLVKRIYGRLSAPVALQGHDTTRFP